MNIEKTETLEFTYGRPFHTSQRHYCPLTKQGQLGKRSIRKLLTSTLFNDRIFRSTTDFASAFGSVNDFKIADMLEFLVCCCFSPFVLTQNHLRRRLTLLESRKIMKTPLGEILFRQFKKISGTSFFPFSSATLQSIVEWLLSCEVTSCNL